MNTELRAKAKSDFQKDFFKLMDISMFRKAIENARKYNEKGMTSPMLEPNRNTAKWFSEKLVAK